MNLVWNVSIFERRLGDEIHWHALGLGPDLAVSQSARHRSRLHQAFRSALQKKIKGRSGQRLALCRTGAAARLVKGHLELRFKGKSRRRWEGTCPLLVEVLPGGPSRRIVYSPLRPEDWMLLHADEPRDQWLERFGRQVAETWVKLNDDALAALKANRRDRLIQETFELERGGLADRLKRQAKARDQKVGAGRAPERVLRTLAVDESEDMRYDGERSVGRRRPEIADRLLQRVRRPMIPTVVIGPTGCGKSTAIRRLALDMMEEDGFRLHQELGRCRRVYRLAGRRLIAGMSYVGQWEQRCLDLINEVKEFKMPPVLWFEDLHALGRIGRSRDSRRCLADVFRGPVSRGELMMLGEATAEAWRLLEQDSPGFASLFRPLSLRSPGDDQALSMLLHEGRSQELESSVKIRPSAYRVLMETTGAIFGAEGHPARSLGLMSSLTADCYWDLETEDWVDGSHAVGVMARETGLPRALLESSTPLNLLELRRRLAAGVRGQEAAVTAVVELIARLKAGLTDSRRPYGVFLFTGPTGTGKTELTKYLAAWLYGSRRRLLRFDMGEHADPWSAGRLAGDRFEPRGLLTEAVRAQPFSVVLLDEIEKAHPSVLNLLLQVFDEGRLTNAAGDVASFTHTVIVMTSNLGAENRSRVGFGADPNALLHDIQRAVAAFFPPELYNRIDRVVPFGPLAPETVREIAEAELKRLLSRRGPASRGLFISAGPAVVDRVAAEGFSAEHGARAVKRYLDREVATVLSEVLASRPPSRSGAPATLRLFAPSKVKDGGPRFAAWLWRLEEAAPLAGESSLEDLLSMAPARRQTWAVGPLLQRVEHALARLRSSSPAAETTMPAPTDEPWSGAGPASLSLRDELIDALESIAALLGREAERLFPDEGELWEAEKAPRLRIVHRDAMDVQWVRLVNPRLLTPQAVSSDRLLSISAEAELLISCSRDLDSSAAQDDVTVEIFTIGDGDSRFELSDRLKARPPSCLHWLAEVYLRDGLEPVDFAAESEAGEILAATGDESSADALRRALGRRPRRLVMQLQGLGAYQRLAPEAGSHELCGETGSELVVVRVQRHGGADAGVRLRGALGRSRDFLAALRSGEIEVGALGSEGSAANDDPDRPGQLIRRMRFDPLGADSVTDAARGAVMTWPETGCPPTDCEVEDFRLCMSVKLRVSHLADALQPLRRRLQTWRPPAGVDTPVPFEGDSSPSGGDTHG